MWLLEGPRGQCGGVSSGIRCAQSAAAFPAHVPAARGGQQHQASLWGQVLLVTQRAVPSEPPPWARSHGSAPPRGKLPEDAINATSQPSNGRDFSGVGKLGTGVDFTRCVPSKDVDSSSDFLYSLEFMFPLIKKSLVELTLYIEPSLFIGKDPDAGKE